MNASTKTERTPKRWMLLLGVIVAGALLAGCAADEEPAEEDVGEGGLEPEPDIGPQEEETQPQEPDPVGTNTTLEESDPIAQDQGI